MISILPKPKLEEQMTHAIGILRCYAFIVKRESQIFDMHSLVHLATRIWVQREGFATQAVENAAVYLITIFPSDDLANRSPWRDYLPHAYRVLRDSNAQDMKLGYRLFWLVGACLYQDGRFKETVWWFEEGWKWYTYHCAENRSQRLEHQFLLALAYRSNGQIHKAIPMLEHAVATRRQEAVTEEDYPALPLLQSELAEAYIINGQIDRGIQMLGNAVAAAQKTLVEEQIPVRLGT